MEEREARPAFRIAAKEIGEGPVYIYGKGNGYQTAKSFIFDRIGKQEIVVTDRRFQEDRAAEDGTTELTYETFVRTVKSNKGTVVVSIGSDDIFRQVSADLMSRGISEIRSAKEFYEYHLSYNENIRLEDCIGEIDEGSDEIAYLDGRLGDDKSRVILSQLFDLYRNTRSTIDCEQLADQYLAKDINVQIDLSCYLCAGAYDGDTVRSFIASGLRIGKLVCFEPDIINFKRLVCSIADLESSKVGEIFLYPTLLGDQTTVKSFSSFGSTNSTCMGDEGGLSQVVCSVDDVIPSLCPTYISMDIEGSEISALRGMSKMLRRHKPGMAVAVYHKISDLWVIQRELESYGYKEFYLRNYSGAAAETILYAF